MLASSALRERESVTPKWKMLAARAASALPRAEDLGEVGDGAGAAGGDDGNLTAALTAAVSSQSKPARVPSESMEVRRISPAPRCLGFAGPFDDAAAGGLAAAADIDLGVADGIGGAGSRRASMATMTAWAPKLRADLADECGAGDGGGVDADLVGAGVEDRFGVVGGADAAADGEGNEELRGGAADGFEQGAAAFVGGGDVEQDDFVGAFGGRGGAASAAGSPASMMSTNWTPLTTRPSRTSRQAMMRLVEHSDPFQADEIAEDLEAGVAGFFGVELDAHDVVAFDGGGEGLDVMRWWRRCLR